MEVQNHSHTGEKVVWTRCIVKAVDPVHGEIQMVTWGQGNFSPGQSWSEERHPSCQLTPWNYQSHNDWEVHPAGPHHGRVRMLAGLHAAGRQVCELGHGCLEMGSTKT